MYYREEDSKKWNSEQIITENYNEGGIWEHRDRKYICTGNSKMINRTKMLKSLAQTYENSSRKAEPSNLSVSGGKFWEETEKRK